MVRRQNWFGYELFVLESARISVSICTLGAAVTSVRVDGRERTLGYATPEEYMRGTAYVGAIVGRYANRIHAARFSLNGKEYQLSANENGNQLHGGSQGFDKRIWSAVMEGEDAVHLTLLSPDGENGYPGNVRAAVTYTVSDDEFRIVFEGDSDADTVFAPATHIYWNLNGSRDILSTRLWINADAYLPVDAQNIPTGELRSVCGEFDFTKEREIGRDYDHCFVLNGKLAARAAAGDLCMTLYTDYPAVQFYTGASLQAPHQRNQGFALEPEYYPDSPNREEFPTPILRKGAHFHKYAAFRFEAR